MIFHIISKLFSKFSAADLLFVGKDNCVPVKNKLWIILLQMTFENIDVMKLMAHK